MKIALAHKRLDNRGGSELDLYRTAIGLRDLGHEIHLFCSEFGIEAPEGTFVHRVPIIPLGRTARLWSFASLAPKIIRRSRCDVVVNFGRMVSQDVLRSGGGSHRAFLQTLAEAGGLRRRAWQILSPYHRSLLALERQQFHPGHYTSILAVSREVKRELVQTYAVPEEKIAVIYNGVDQNRFQPAWHRDGRETVRKRWGIPFEAPLVLFIGNGFRRKGLDRLLKACALPEMKDSYLLVVGDDAQRGRYRALAETRTNGKVIFAGRRGDVENFYGAADIVALPALQEAFGNVVLEALASGLPVVLSQTVGASEVLTGGLADGIVADPEDPEKLAAKLLVMLERSRDTEFRLEAKRLSEAYSWKSHFLELNAFLREVVAQRDCRSPS
jgi:UDP-glucose:(heptosyl)LPS alpha-1,3-glucosyltransferase